MKELRDSLKRLYLALELCNLYDFVPNYTNKVIEDCKNNDVVFYDLEFLKQTCQELEGNDIDKIREYICNYVLVNVIND